MEHNGILAGFDALDSVNWLNRFENKTTKIPPVLYFRLLPSEVTKHEDIHRCRFLLYSTGNQHALSKAVISQLSMGSRH